MKRGHVIGVELNEKICQISFYDDMQREPHTMEVNADNYQIPLLIARKGNSWVCGKEAQKAAVVANSACASDLLVQRAMSLYRLATKCMREFGFCPCLFSLF